MILTKKQLAKITDKQRDELLNVLYGIEDRLNYKCKNISKTINYIQNTYIQSKVTYKDRVELAINYLKENDYLIEEEQWLLDLLEGKHNGNTY